MDCGVVRQLVQIDFAEVGEPRPQTAQPLERGDPFGKLIGPGQTRASAESLQTRVSVDPDEAVQGEGAGLTVGQTVILGQGIGAGMGAGRLGQRKGQTAEQGGERKIRPRLRIAAVPPGLFQIVQNEAHGLLCHLVGDRLVVDAPIALQGMRKRVQAGVHRRSLRHGEGQQGIDDSRLRHEGGVVDRFLLPAVADHGDLRDLAPGSGGRGNGQNRDMDGREGAGAAEAVDGFPIGTCSGCGEFGGVHRAAAADADHTVGSGLPDQSDVRYSIQAAAYITFFARLRS